MTAPTSSNDPRREDPGRTRDRGGDDRLFEIIAEYLSAAEAGNPPDRDAFLKAHSEYSNDLRPFFANLDELANLAEPARVPRPEDGVGQRTASFAIPATLRGGSRFGRDGDYELQEELGRGGMGIVFRARQVSLNRTVAVKMILSGGLAKEEQIKRFHAEAEAAAALEHPGIVPVYEVDEHDGCHYFSMGFVEGQSLAERLHDGPLPTVIAARLIHSIAEAVAYAHEQGIIHRDLKPHNVLLDRKGDPKITDFGLAKRISEASDLTETGQLLGTPSYMPPEQASGRHEEIGPAADVYSLGAILYAMLIGHPPFQAANRDDILFQVKFKEPLAPRTLNPRIPRDLETICLKCLEKNASRRYPMARLLADEVGRYLRGETIHARPVGRVAKTGRWCRRNPLAAMLIGLVAIVATVSPVVAVNYARLAERETRAREDETRARLEADRQRDRADLEAEQSRRALYFTRMVAAQIAWDSNQIASAVELLESQIPAAGDDREDLRSFEWYLLWRLTHPDTIPLGPHERGVNCVAVTADGRRVVTGGVDKRICIFDASTGRLLDKLEGHRGEVTSLCCLPTARGETLVSGSSDQTLRCWDLESGAELTTARITLSGRPVSLAAAAHRALVAVAQLDGKVVLVRLASRVLPEDASAQPADEVSLAGSTHTLRPARNRPFPVPGQVAFSPDGQSLALCESSRVVEVWDVATGERRLSQRMPSGVLALSFSRDGRRLAAAGNKLIAVWDLEANEVEMLEEFTRVASSIRFSPVSDSHLAVACLNSAVEVWDVAAGARILPLQQHEAAVKEVRFFPDGKRIVTGSVDRFARIWDMEKALAAQQRELIRGTRPINAIAFADEGELLIAAMGSEIATWNLKSRRRGPFALTLPTQAVSLATASDGAAFAFQSVPLEVYESSLRDPPSMRLLGKGTGVPLGIALLPDGRVLSAASRMAGDSWVLELVVFDPQRDTETSLATNSTVHPSTLAISPDRSRLAVGGIDGRVEVIDLSTGTVAAKQAAHQDSVAAVAWSPDGSLVASAGKDRRVAFWRVSQPRAVATRKLSQVVNLIAFAPDGKTVATGGIDRAVKLWDVESGRVKVTLPTREGVKALSFTPDGRTLIAGLYNGELRVWDGRPLPAAGEPGGGDD